MDLTPTSYVVLGMLRHEARSGYEIKQTVDHSTRFFWAASYGQIYPELRRLAKLGLVEGEERPTGGRRRTVYRLTNAGRAELARWLAQPPEVFELRDEGLLKLFFASAGDRETARAAIEARGRVHAAKLAVLEELEPQVAALDDPYPYAVLRHGIEFSRFIVDWAERATAELDGSAPPARSAAGARGRR